MTTYPVGAFFLARIPGASGYLINLGQALAGDSSRWSHAGIILNSSGLVLEAEPGGARLAMLSEYEGRPLLISDAPVRTFLSHGQAVCGSCASGLHDACAGIFAGPVQWHDCGCRCADEQTIRDRVVAEARKLVGVPYSALDYLALAALHLRLPSAAIRRRVESSGHMMCSQLCDAVYARAGIHLFEGKFPGDVMPSDLAAYAEDHAL